jgi:hypothetical protein
MWITEPSAMNWRGKLFPMPLWTRKTDALNHILQVQDCPLFEVQRQQSWPEDLDTQITVGEEADPRAKVQFVASIDLKI